uniref:7TM_GPCR_Srx domain-containing protein n=1 Tax=Heterorhabditis bacteriophora TaxID=37862 RepID=A0A1I7X433_HETBA
MSVIFTLNTRIFPIIGFMGQMLTMFALSLERAVSTTIPTYYEMIKTPSFGICLGLFSSISAISISYLLLFPGVNWGRMVITYTVRIQENQERYQILIYIHLLIELRSIVIFYVALFENHQQSLKICQSKNAKQLKP